jgi:metal-responsive CopG/Arc/MetJ family transcriptional regulator
MTTKLRQIVSVAFPAKEANQIEKLSEQYDGNRSMLIRAAVKFYIKQHAKGLNNED